MAVGKAYVMKDAVERVTGTLPYGINLKLPDMLYAKVLRSPVPHAKVVSIDAAAAEQLLGVVAVLTAADLGQPGGPGPVSGVMMKDQPVVAGERVRYIGEPVALVAAESVKIAEEALDLIAVDYEELPAVYEAEAAHQPDAPTLHDNFPDNCFVHAKLRRGDIEAGFAEADEIIEETFFSPMAQHVSLEPHVTVAQWNNRQLTVWSGTQAPNRVQEVLAELFGLELNAVRLIVPPLGGGYGGKGHLRLEAMVAALAWKVGGRPVKLALTRAEEFVTVTKHAATLTIKSGVRKDGALTARKVTIYWNGGAYADSSPGLVRAGMVRSVGPYRIPHAWCDSYGIYTNLPPAAAFRGAMSSQGTWAYESHMDTLAHRLGMDPLAFRLKNLLVEGDPFVTGETMHDIYFVECLQSCADKLGWARPLDRSRETATQKRGRGLAVMMKSMVPTSQSECRLQLSDQGQLTLFTSTVEMGQGAHTALAQIAAEAMELPFDSVAVVGPDTAQTPFDSMTSSARSTTMMGTAILKGTEALRQKLIEAAVPLFEQPAEELSISGGYVISKRQPEQRMSYAEVLQRNQYESLEALGEFKTKAGVDPETGQGVSTLHWHQGAGACEIEVDTETGKVNILRYAAASFAGRVVNPQLARLQNDGNVIFGLGPAMLEEIVVDEGQVVNPNLSDYMIPSFLDIPAELDSISLEADPGEFHGIGEMTLPPVAPAIANAIFDAVGVRIRDLPLSAEKVLRALNNES
ncbi:MAG: xanthine dehydrogenase family protein molybdopterin-binding subunit [Chloroflexi bacterium]|nr:xanthine dehydrogenase family protein molybdopterin-binding subunit [Chloroflexota bacterium]